MRFDLACRSDGRHSDNWPALVGPISSPTIETKIPHKSLAKNATELVPTIMTGTEPDKLSEDKEPDILLKPCVSKRQQILSEGFYVEGSVMGIDVLFCIDTSFTILSTKIYEMIPESKRPPL